MAGYAAEDLLAVWAILKMLNQSLPLHFGSTERDAARCIFGYPNAGCKALCVP